MAVKFITLSVRAAIKGGLSPQVAYALGDRYESAAVECNGTAETKQVLDTMFDDFVHRVHRLRKNNSLSKPILDCCDYISLHIFEKIDLDAMAESVWYTKYYLTRKFKQEMGVSIWDYVNQQKAERAKLLLQDPSKTIQDVADQLSYCSRSYFSEIFKQHVGLWPSDYRTQELNM